MKSIARASNTRIQSKQIYYSVGNKGTDPHHMASQMVEFVHKSFITVDSTQMVLSSLTAEILNSLIWKHFETI